MSEEMTCPHCGRTVPAGNYCGACGAHLTAEGGHSPLRPHAFAANPHEHVLHPSIASTLFPHLPPGRSLPYRLALLLIAAALVLLGYLRLTGPMVALAVAAIPLLYLLYLYEVEAYGREPLYTMLVTAGVGAVLGAGWALLTGRFITQTLLLYASPSGAPTWRILVAAVLLPWVAQILMLAGALALRFTRPVGETLDGFVFGAMSALGFVFTFSLVNLLPELEAGPIAVAPGFEVALHAILHGLLLPLIDAGTTGLIAAAIWLYGAPIRPLPRYGWTITLPAVILFAAAIQVGLGLVDILVVDPVAATLLYVTAALILLFVIRIVLHHMLLSEMGFAAMGREIPCPHCGRLVPDMAYCANCGVARSATPRLGRQPRATT